MNLLKTFLLVSSVFISNIAISHENVEFSGFARIVGGYYDQDSAEFRDYGSKILIDNDSLIALRTDYTATDNLSFVAQVIEHTGKTRESGIQWLYADYKFNNQLKVRLGRQRMPLFQYSDVIDVGFAYPWITAPVTIYNEYLFTEFDGVLTRYHISNKSLFGYIEAYYGNYKSDVRVFGDIVDTKTENLFGTVLNISFGNLTMRFATAQANIAIDQPLLNEVINILRQAGFNESANALSIDNTVNMYTAGFKYEDLKFFLSGEVLRFDSSAFLVGQRNGAYLTAGINDYPFIYHATAAIGNSKYDEKPTDIPLGVSPLLDQIYFAANQVFDNIPKDEGAIFTLGTRYEMTENAALKAEVSIVRGATDSRGFLSSPNPNAGKQSGTLFQLAVEYVF